METYLLKYYSNERAEEIMNRYKVKSQLTPGENVGIIAAQSFGSCQTQLSLNSFHSTGLSTGGGIPRFTEILNVTKNPKYNYIRAQFRTKKILTFVTIRDCIIVDFTMLNESNHSEFLFLLDLYKLKLTHTIGLRYSLRPEVIGIYEIEPYQIAKVLEGFNVQCTWDPNETFIDMWFSYEDFSKLKYEEILDTKLFGIDGVTSSDIITSETNSYTYHLVGGTLIDVISYMGVNQQTIQCSDMWQILELFGIEAAYQFLIDEMVHVLKDNGLSIYECHLQILIGIMTISGTLTPISRFGLKLDNDHPLSKATFEESLDTLIQAGIYNKVDYLQGASASILVGKTSKSGTGFFDCFVKK